MISIRTPALLTGGRLPTQAHGAYAAPRNDSGSPAPAAVSCAYVFAAAQHPVQPRRQPPAMATFACARLLPHRQRRYARFKLRLVPRRALRRFHQQKAHQRLPCLRDLSQPLLAPAGMLAAESVPDSWPLSWHSRTDCTGRSSARTPAPSAGPRPDASSAAPPPAASPASASTACSAPSTCCSSRSSIVSSSARRRAAYGGNASFSSCSRPASLHSCRFLCTPWFSASALQLVLHLRAHPHQLVPVQQQLPHIALLRPGHPQPRKTVLQQQRSGCAPRLAGPSSAAAPPPARIRAASPIHNSWPNSASIRSNHCECPSSPSPPAPAPAATA